MPFPTRRRTITPPQPELFIPAPQTSLVSSAKDEQYSSSGTDASYESYLPADRKRKRRKGKPMLPPLDTCQNKFVSGLKWPPVLTSMSPKSLLRHFSPNPGGATTNLAAPPPLSQSMSLDQMNTPVKAGRQSKWDRLDKALEDLKVSGYPPHFRKSVDEEHFDLVDTITSTRKSYRRLLLYCGDKAQLLINALQWFLLYRPSLDGPKKRKFMQALLRLSKRTELLPQVFKHVDIVVPSFPFIGTPNIDIFRTTHNGRQICLKKYRICKSNAHWKDMTQLMIREAILWYNHRHPNLLPFEGIYQPDNNIEVTYLISPFFKNGTVVQYLAKYPHVDRRLLFSDVVAGVACLHRNKIVHADIKGDNILVSSSGRACIADLGLSRLTDTQILTWPSVQSTSPPCCSFPWLAPELLKAQISPQIVGPTFASDIYALGSLGYEIFTGEIPFKEIMRRSHWAIPILAYLDEVVNKGKHPQKPEPTSDSYVLFGLTESIWSVLESCWSYDPGSRPAISHISKEEFLVDLVDDRPEEERSHI